MTTKVTLDAAQASLASETSGLPRPDHAQQGVFGYQPDLPRVTDGDGSRSHGQGGVYSRLGEAAGPRPQQALQSDAGDSSASRKAEAVAAAVRPSGCALPASTAVCTQVWAWSAHQRS